MTARLLIVAAVALACIAGGTRPAAADAARGGTLDPTFGSAGQTLDRFRPDGQAGRLLVAPDGSLYAVTVELLPSGPIQYGIRVARFTAAGALVGHRTLTFADLPNVTLADAALAPNGDVIVAANGYDPGGAFEGGLMIDLNASLDRRPSFGVNGTEVLSARGEWRVGAVVVKPSGEIGAAGDLLNGSGEPQLLELAADGSLERSVAPGGVTGEVADAVVAPNGDVVVGLMFGDAAVRVWRQPWGIASAIAPAPAQLPMYSGGVQAKLSRLALASNGSIVVGGGDRPDGDVTPFTLTPGTWVARLTADGALDPSFGNEGATAWVYNPSGTDTGLLVEPDGAIVTAAAGYGDPNTLTLSRLLADGKPDTAFGSSVSLPVHNGFANAVDVVEQPSGRLVTLSVVDDGAAQGFALTGFTGPVADKDLALASMPAVTIEATGPLGAAAAFVPPAAVDDDGDAVVTCAPAPGTIVPIGTATVTCTAADADDTASPVTTSFPLTVRDTTPPALHVPGTIVLEATGPDGASIGFTASASDLVDGLVPATCSSTGGSVFPLGTTDVTCTAHDRAGNVAHAGFQVIVQDTTPPDVQVPADLTVDATSPAGAVVSFASSALDIVDGVVPTQCSPASGSTFAVGSTVVGCVAWDRHRHEGTASFTVTVKGAAQQLDDVAVSLAGVGPGTSLGSKLTAARSALAAGDTPTACGTLRAFGNEAHAQAGKKLTADLATQLVGAATRIRSVLAC